MGYHSDRQGQQGPAQEFHTGTHQQAEHDQGNTEGGERIAPQGNQASDEETSGHQSKVKGCTINSTEALAEYFMSDYWLQ